MNCKSLKDHGLQVNDYVLLNCNPLSSGAIYQIVFDQQPIKPAMITKTSFKKMFDAETGEYVTREVTQHGYWNEDGSEIKPKSAMTGYVRIKPVYEFFTSHKFKIHMNVKNGLLVSYRDLQYLEKVSIESLGTKYVELGELMKTLARNYGS